MVERRETRELETVSVGSAAEATAALGRLLAVTQASYERRAQLERALQSRVVIEQAKGIVAERMGLMSTRRSSSSGGRRAAIA